MNTAKPTLLITGASGVLGRALIDELSPDFTIIALRHRTRLADPRVREFAGSLNDPTLGLSEHDYARLADSVDVVLHGAAATSWKATPESIRATNIDGTRAMLDFAKQARAPMYYVSTAFVANPPSADGGRFAGARAYIESKVEAEQLTRDSDVATVILRPSVVIGDSGDGRMAAFQGLHRIAGLIARGMVPLIACDEDALMDVVPQDVVKYKTDGELVEGALRLVRAAGLDHTAPRFIAAEAVDRLLLPLLDEALSPELRAMFAELLEMTWLFQMPAALPTSMAQLGLAAEMTRPRLIDTYDKSMRFWAQAKGLLPVAADEDLDDKALAS